MNTDILFSSEYVDFIRTDYTKRSKVIVRNKKNPFIHRIYRFNKTDVVYESPFISWENLNYCGGWVCDKKYLMTAVQDGKKLCATLEYITEADVTFIEKYNKDCVVDVSRYEDKSPEKNMRINVTISKKGKITDYIDIHEVFNVYKVQDVHCLEEDDVMLGILDFSISDIIGFKTEVNWFTPDCRADLVVTGLLLGYPIESTASIIWE